MINIIDNYKFEHDEDLIYKYVEHMNNITSNKSLFSLVFVNDEYIQSMNSEFRLKNAPTDVLSFEDDMDGYIGDILISIDTAKRQAIEYGHSKDRELFFLITHGYLHLLGYDHMNEIDEKQMFALQRKILNTFEGGKFEKRSW